MVSAWPICKLVKEGLDNPGSTLNVAGGPDADADDERAARLEVELGVEGQHAVDLAGVDVQPLGDQVYRTARGI